MKKVTCYSYCYILKVTSYFISYFTDTLVHHLKPDPNHSSNAKP